ncbi:MAG: gliding motility-associated C-terminal domain-containing protein, partial [Bacteroidetes bacterium]|nr:gliding motility-associated C-terminal domain-containing protein [Bacteroidota bacterium]
MIDVIANDNDPDNDPLTISIETFPDNGLATVTSNNQINYLPDEGYYGTDSIEYVVCDDGIPSLCDTAKVWIVVNATFFVPSGISPNGDELNDRFLIKGIEKFFGSELLIYNRWGKKVFESTNYDNSWRGTNKRGEDLPDGTYFYILNLSDGTNRSGYIVLRR